MAIDPRHLRPTQLVQLLNSTPLGAIFNERQLFRHRERAGLRIGDGRTVDLVRYAAWLHQELHRPSEAEDPAASYEAVKERARQRALMLSLSGRNIGELPAVAQPERRQRAARDFRAFCEAYFPQTFNLPWSDDHLKVIAKIERAVLLGGLFAMAMPRGSGKTSLCERACLWAVLYGHREFPALIGSDEKHAAGMLESIKVELETNTALGEDFPEVTVPIRALEGINQRAAGQLYRGKQTYIGWTANEIVLPTMPGSASSGAIIRVAGITGSIRGMKHQRADGMAVRPSLVLIDDPQTDESAASPSQCAARVRILSGAILGLAGPGRKIAGLAALTVIRQDDMADRILSRELYPQWQGERTKLVYAFPSDTELWARYAELRADALRNDLQPTAATEFYAEHRTAMDAGAVIAWPARKLDDELSAVQHAMNLKLDRGEYAFFAEFQNEPLPETPPSEADLTLDGLGGRLNRLRIGAIPKWATKLTLFCDVHEKLLYWMLCAWEETFSGAIVAYGTEPEQRVPYFSMSEVRHTLAVAAPRAGLEGALFAGLERLLERILGREWLREDGATVRVDRCLIDAGWKPDVVHQFCRSGRWGGVALPSLGKYVGAGSVPFGEYLRKRGEQLGLNWRIPLVAGKRLVRHLVFDTNYWKSFVAARLTTPLGDAGALTVYGEEPERHRLLFEHFLAEQRVRTQGRGRVVDEWKGLPGRDNHWWDCLVGCAVAASREGCLLAGTDQHPRPVKSVRWADRKRKANASQEAQAQERRAVDAILGERFG